jgi:hypothetical protein
MGCIALVLIFLIYFEYVHGLGFPDGFITELAYAQRKLAYVFIAISMSIGSYFIYLGTRAGRKEIGKTLSAAIILYLVFIASFTLINYYYHLHLTGSGGG